jgi:DNA-binding transcriptional LysR family regulator
MSDISFSTVCNWLKFKHLVLIETLARTRNMHAAAQHMNLSQPAVSKMLREIERLLGFDVFERLPRNMPPTALGEHVVRYA